MAASQVGRNRRLPAGGDQPGEDDPTTLGDIPSGYVKIAIENGHRNSGFSHEKW